MLLSSSADHATRPRYVAVPRMWAGSTILCIGTGPSLTIADLHRCHLAVRAGFLRAIAVNDAYTLAPWAHVLYAADHKWWRWHQPVPDYQLPPLLYTIDPLAVPLRPSIRLLNYTGHTGIESSPTGVRTGGHGGYQAINIAVHLGAKKIILLGYDLMPAADGRNHFFGEHPDGDCLTYAHRVGSYETLLEPLQKLGIILVNASPRTAITVIPRASLETALA